MFTFSLLTPNENVIEFVVKFFYPDSKKQYKNRRKVVCKIYEKETGCLVCEGYATTHELDKYNPVEGRKKSLTHALGSDFSKLERTVIWGYFFDTFQRKV